MKWNLGTGLRTSSDVHMHTGAYIHATFIQRRVHIRADHVHTYCNIHNNEIYSQLSWHYSEQKTCLATPELGLLLRGVKVCSFHLNSDQMENHGTVWTVCCRLTLKHPTRARDLTFAAICFTHKV